MASAAVAAAATGGSLEELRELAVAGAAHLFWLGLRIAEATAAARPPPEREQGVSTSAAARSGSWSLGVAKVAPAAVEACLERHPLNVLQPGRLSVVVNNGPAACVVAGDPGSVCMCVLSVCLSVCLSFCLSVSVCCVCVLSVVGGDAEALSMLERWLRQRASGGELGAGQAGGPVALHVRDWGCAPPFHLPIRPHTLVA
jgi:malonyl CoA-acyl carrier protein transacylase